jgi:hypothetical protein
MQYEFSSEKMAIIPRPLTNDISKKNFEIRSTRYKLITLLSIELVGIISYLINNEEYFVFILVCNNNLFYSTNC